MLRNDRIRSIQVVVADTDTDTDTGVDVVTVVVLLLAISFISNSVRELRPCELTVLLCVYMII